MEIFKNIIVAEIGLLKVNGTLLLFKMGLKLFVGKATSIIEYEKDIKRATKKIK